MPYDHSNTLLTNKRCKMEKWLTRSYTAFRQLHHSTSTTTTLHNRKDPMCLKTCLQQTTLFQKSVLDNLR
jgi:hypothetical protein